MKSLQDGRGERDLDNTETALVSHTEVEPIYVELCVIEDTPCD